MVLNSGYRNPLTFTDEVIEQSERALERLRSALRPALPGAKALPQPAWMLCKSRPRLPRAVLSTPWMMISIPPVRWGICSTWCG